MQFRAALADHVVTGNPEAQDILGYKTRALGNKNSRFGIKSQIIGLLTFNLSLHYE